MYQTETIYKTFVEDHLKIIPVVTEEMLLKESVGVGHMLSQKLTSEYKVLS
jgi:hypothetical protein